MLSHQVILMLSEDGAICHFDAGTYFLETTALLHPSISLHTLISEPTDSVGHLQTNHTILKERLCAKINATGVF